MRLTKNQAKKRFPKSEKQYGYICAFHMTHPDQEAVMDTCPKCVYVQDDCGCGFDEFCSLCSPEDFKEAGV